MKNGMDFCTGNLEYRAKEVYGTWLVWLSDLNRYIRLEEPAFRVFRRLATGINPEEVIRGLKSSYGLPDREALQFVTELRQRLESLYTGYEEPDDPSVAIADLPVHNCVFEEKHFRLAGKTVRIMFGDQWLLSFVYPAFRHLETVSNHKKCDLNLEVFRYHRQVYLVVNRLRAFTWPATEAFRMKSGLYMQLIDMIHDHMHGDWMGVIHASSVFRDGGAVMFPALPGKGKSTLAALLMAHGCGLVSDDFTPLSGKDTLIYPFPAGVSVKRGSLPVLEPYFPDLITSRKVRENTTAGEIEWLAPGNHETEPNKGYPVRAIVFVDYGASLKCSLEMIPNLEALNDFLSESWLASDAKSAEKFLEWFFQIPCYTLHYGDSVKAVESIVTLLDEKF